MGFYKDGKWRPDASEIASGEHPDSGFRTCQLKRELADLRAQLSDTEAKLANAGGNYLGLLADMEDGVRAIGKVAELKAQLAERDAALAGLHEQMRGLSYSFDSRGKMDKIFDSLPASAKADAEILTLVDAWYRGWGEPPKLFPNSNYGGGCSISRADVALYEAVRAKQEGKE